MDVAVGRGGPAMPEQAPRDMQAFAVHDRVRGVRMPQVMKPRIGHDSGRVARLDPEPPQVIRTQRPVPLVARKHPLPGRRFGEAIQQLPWPLQLDLFGDGSECPALWAGWFTPSSSQTGLRRGRCTN